MSLIGSAINSKEIINQSQRHLDADAITEMAMSVKKGNSEGLLYTLNEMKGNFFEINDEFYKYVSQYTFLELDVIYKAIINEARVLQQNEIFKNMVNDYFNERFMKCLHNYYKHSPTFFKTLFPVNEEYLTLSTRNIHQSFQKYYYLLCIINFTNKNKNDEKIQALPIEFKKNIIDWCERKNDPDIEFQLNGPEYNVMITFNFAEHYKTLISTQNTITDINEYNKIVRLQNIESGTYDLLSALNLRQNVYNKTPDMAREYIFNLDSIYLKEKYKDIEGNLIFNLSYTDFGDTTSETTRATLESIDRLQTIDTTLSISNLKQIEKVFNMYSRIKVSSLVVDKNTYLTNLSQLKTVYLVFKGVTCSDRTMGINKKVLNGDLAIPGTFEINSQGNYAFVPKTEYTTYRPERTRVTSCELYLTTYNGTLMNKNSLSSYAISLNLDRLKFYNVPLKIVSPFGVLYSADNPGVRINQFGQFPDLLFNHISAKDKLNFQQTLTDILRNIETNYGVQKNLIDESYATAMNYPRKNAIVGPVLMTNWEIIDNELTNEEWLYMYDFDTKLINIRQLVNGLPHDSDLLNSMLYSIFMHDQLFTYINNVFDYHGIGYISVYDKDALKSLLTVLGPEYDINKYISRINDIYIPVNNELFIKNYGFTITDEYIIQPLNDLMFSSNNNIILSENFYFYTSAVCHTIFTDPDKLTERRYEIDGLTDSTDTTSDYIAKEPTYFKILDYIDIKIPLTEYVLKIYPTTSSVLYRGEEKTPYNFEEVAVNYVIYSDTNEIFNKHKITIGETTFITEICLDLNINYANIASVYDGQTEEEQAAIMETLNLALAFKSRTTIEYNFIVRQYGTTLTSEQIKNYITITKAVLTYITGTTTDEITGEIINDIKTINLPYINYDISDDGELNLLSLKYIGHDCVELYSTDINNNENKLLFWTVKNFIVTNADDYHYYTEGYTINNLMKYSNPLTSSDMLLYEFNGAMFNNNISLINIFNSNYGDMTDINVFNYINDGTTDETQSFAIENCMIATSNDNFKDLTYIKQGNIYFNNSSNKLEWNNTSDTTIRKTNEATIIHLYDSNKYDQYNIYNIIKSFPYLTSLNYTVNSDFYEVFGETYSDFLNDIYKIIDGETLDKLRFVLAYGNTILPPVVGYAVLHYIYRYITQLYITVNEQLYGSDSDGTFLQTILEDEDSYTTVWTLSLSSFLTFNSNELSFIKTVSSEILGDKVSGIETETDVDLLNKLRFVCKNCFISVETTITLKKLIIAVHFIYLKIDENEDVIGVLQYQNKTTEENGKAEIDEETNTLAKIFILVSPTHEDYYMLQEFISEEEETTSKNIYTKTKYRLANIYTNKYNKCFNIFGYQCMLNVYKYNININTYGSDDYVMTYFAPTYIICVKLARAHVFYTELSPDGNNYILFEKLLFTPYPINNYTQINYYKNIATNMDLNNVFGSDSYYKRPIYYYQIYYNEEDKTKLVFNSTETLAVHDYMTFNNIEYRNATEKEAESENMRLNIIHKNLYQILNFNKYVDPSKAKIDNDKVKIIFNKSDIELSLTWS